MSATACQVRRAEGDMLKHEGRATDMLGAASRCRGADSEYLGGLLTALPDLRAQLLDAPAERDDELHGVRVHLRPLRSLRVPLR